MACAMFRHDCQLSAWRAQQGALAGRIDMDTGIEEAAQRMIGDLARFEWIESSFTPAKAEKGDERDQQDDGDQRPCNLPDEPCH